MKKLLLSAAFFIFIGVTQTQAQISFERDTIASFTGLSSGDISFADIDNDGDQDVLIVGKYRRENGATGQEIALYVQDTNGAFNEVDDTPFQSIFLGEAIFADVNNDSYPDILIIGTSQNGDDIDPSAKLFVNGGDADPGSFTEVTNSPFTAVKKGAAAFADIDGDNDKDLLITGRDNSGNFTAKLYKNNSSLDSAAFSEVLDSEGNSAFEGVVNASIAFTDYDGDNDQDVIIAGEKESFFGGTNATINLYENDGQGNFTDSGLSFAAYKNSSLATADVDGQNGPDIILTGGSNDLNTKLYLNDGQGGFTQPDSGIPSLSIKSGDLNFADVDNDDDPDLIITGSLSTDDSRATKLFRNVGGGNFIIVDEAKAPFIPVSASRLDFADVDSDNDQDVIITGTADDNNFKKAILYKNNTIAADYIYDEGSWSPSDPSNGVSSVDDIIEVVSGTTSITGNTDARNLFVDNKAILNQKGVLKIQQGLDVAPLGNLVFTSDANGTGQLAELPVDANVKSSGNVTIQRYIPAGDEHLDTSISKGRAFRFLSSAVTTTSSIHANWQEGATSYTDNPKQDYGTHITGLNILQGNSQDENNSDKDQMAGFDFSPSGNPSMFFFDNDNQSWESVANTDEDTLTAGTPYRLMVRGDRSIDVTVNGATPTNTILEATGNLKTGPYTQENLSETLGAYNLVGNPYQSIVDMNAVLANSTNLNTEHYYVWDASKSARGAYVTVDLLNGENSSGSEANQYLQPGQAVFVRTLNQGTSSISFLESDKATDQSETTVFTSDQDNYINLQLLYDGSVSDALRIYFDENGENSVVANDAPKLGNLDENLAVLNNGNYLSLEHRANPLENDSLTLFANQYRHENYVFKATLNGDFDLQPYLVDSFTGEETALSDGENTVSFTLDPDDEASMASDRFMIVFNETNLSNNPVEASKISLYPNPLNEKTLYVEMAEAGDYKVKISNMLGQQVYGKDLSTGGNKNIAVKGLNLASGNYILTATNAAGDSFTDKLIVK
jgi:hypothetical protein